MSVRVTATEGKVALFDSVTNWAFGPVFDTEEDANNFLGWCERRGLEDVRLMSEQRLLWVYGQWHAALTAAADEPEYRPCPTCAGGWEQYGRGCSGCGGSGLVLWTGEHSRTSGGIDL
jgi:hypothetical protein